MTTKEHALGHQPSLGRSIIWLVAFIGIFVSYGLATASLLLSFGLEQSRHEDGFMLALIMQPDQLESTAAIFALLGSVPLLIWMSDFKQQRWWHTLAISLPSWPAMLLATLVGLGWGVLMLVLWQFTAANVLQSYAQPTGDVLVIIADLMLTLVLGLLVFGYLFTAWVTNQGSAWRGRLGFIILALLLAALFSDFEALWLVEYSIHLAMMTSFLLLRVRFHSAWPAILSMISFSLLLETRVWWGF